MSFGYFRRVSARWLEDRWAFWRWNALAWGGFAVVAFTIRWGLFGNAGQALAFTALVEPMAFLLSGALVWLYRRPKLRLPFGVGLAALMVGVSLVAAVFVALAALGWSEVTGWSPPGWSPREEWLLRLVFSWFAFLAWSLAFYALRSKRMADGALEQAERAELDLLRAQLDPHFLFNSLNNVAAEISVHPVVAESMVHELADYLRYSLEQRHAVVVPLASELDAVAAYLRIEQVRFGDRMEARVRADALARRCLVPTFLLQPLVENAMKHGLEADRCVVVIEAGLVGKTLEITISNPGRLPESLEVREGVGLETLRRRLALHYPGRSEFVLGQMEGVVSAELKLRGEPCFG